MSVARASVFDRDNQKVEDWLKQLKRNPLPALLAAGDVALEYFVRRDLQGEAAGPADCLWQLPQARKILKKQLPDGSWPRAGENRHPAINYALIETWKAYRVLVGQYELDRGHPQAQKAAEFLFRCQTAEGDFRGFLANQYATYYTGAVLALLIQAGYAADTRVIRRLEWLLAMRQDDGGWSIPILTHSFDGQTIYRLTSEDTAPVEPHRSRPFSHNWTGMVLRAFAAHPEYRSTEAVVHAARLLKSRFFQPDVYTSYQAASYWVRFDYPFWWSNLLTALDSLSLIGFTRQDGQIAAGLEWLLERQCADGLWDATYAREERENSKTCAKRLWVSLAVCRVMKRYFE